MAIETKVTRRFPDNQVQVDIKVNNSITRHFKMPEEKVDTFCSQYKNNDKNTRFFATAALCGLSIAGAVSGAIIPNLLKVSNKAIKYASSIGLCALGCFGSTKLTERKMIKEEAKLLKSNNAEQIFY